MYSSSFNARWTRRFIKEQGLQQLDRRRKPQATLATEAPKTPTIRSVVNVLPQAASVHSADGVSTALLDHKEDEEEAFHKFHQCRMMQCFPTSKHMDPMWQTTKWLWVCKEGLYNEEISWRLLVSPLTDGSDMAMKDLTR